MTPLSPRTTFSALELNNKKGLLDYCALLFLSLGLHLILASSLQQRSDYKQMKHGNWKNNWTFSLAEDLGVWGGVSVGGKTLCVFGGDEEQVERGGRGV